MPQTMVGAIDVRTKNRKFADFVEINVDAVASYDECSVEQSLATMGIPRQFARVQSTGRWSQESVLVP